MLAKSCNGRDCIRIRSPDNEWQMTLAILYIPLVFALIFVPDYGSRQFVVLMLPREVDK